MPLSLFTLSTDPALQLGSLTVVVSYKDSGASAPEVKVPLGYVSGPLSSNSPFSISKKNLLTSSGSEIQSALKKKGKSLIDLEVNVVIPTSYAGTFCIMPQFVSSVTLKVSGAESGADKHGCINDLPEPLSSSEQAAVALSNIYVSGGPIGKSIKIENKSYCDVGVSVGQGSSVVISSPPNGGEDGGGAADENKAAHYYFPDHGTAPGQIEIDADACLGNSIFVSSRPVVIKQPKTVGLFVTLNSLFNNSVVSTSRFSHEVQARVRSIDRVVSSAVKTALSEFKEDKYRKGTAVFLASVLCDVFYLNRLKLSQSITSNRLLSELLNKMGISAARSFAETVGAPNKNDHDLARAVKKLEASTSAYAHAAYVPPVRKRKLPNLNEAAADVSPLSSVVGHYAQAATDVYTSTTKALKRT